MNTADIRTLYAYTDCANHRLLDAVAELPPEEQQRDRSVSHRSIHSTLVHMLGAERIWLSRWQGASPTGFIAEAEFPDLAAIRAHWQAVEAEREQFIATLTDEALAGTLNYRDTKGNPYALPLGQLMQHAANHATLHRGQIVAMFRQAGAQPPVTDLLYYLLGR